MLKEATQNPVKDESQEGPWQAIDKLKYNCIIKRFFCRVDCTKKKKIKLKDKENLEKQIKRGQEFEDQSFVLLEKEIF